MKYTANLISLGESSARKYAAGPDGIDGDGMNGHNGSNGDGDGLTSYKNYDSEWVDRLHTTMTELGELYHSLSLTTMGEDDSFNMLFRRALEELSVVYHKAANRK